MAIGAVTGVRADLTEMLNKIRDISNQSSAFKVQPLETPATNSFSNTMQSVKSAVSTVDNMQNATESLKNAYILGDQNVSLSDVIVSSQKSKLAFEGLVTVRNKILDAYKEIMNMPV